MGDVERLTYGDARNEEMRYKWRRLQGEQFKSIIAFLFFSLYRRDVIWMSLRCCSHGIVEGSPSTLVLVNVRKELKNFYDQGRRGKGSAGSPLASATFTPRELSKFTFENAWGDIFQLLLVLPLPLTWCLEKREERGESKMFHAACSNEAMDAAFLRNSQRWRRGRSYKERGQWMSNARLTKRHLHKSP